MQTSEKRESKMFDRKITTTIVFLGLVPMLMGARGGCAQAIQEAKEAVPDIRGNYAITHDDAITVTVDIGGVKETYDGLQGGVIDLGEATIDLAAVCKYDHVHCPSEAFWKSVAIDQPLFDPLKKPYNPWLVRVVNVDPTKAEAYMMERGGLVNQHGDLTIGLGLGAVAGPGCALIGASIATTSVELNSRLLATGNLINGKVTVIYSGGCILPTQDGYAGATITLQSSFTGLRTGDFSLPGELVSEPIRDENGDEIDAPQ